MNEKAKNILSALIAIAIVGFVVFAVLYWIIKDNLRVAIQTAVAVAIAGWLAPVLVKYFWKGKK